MRSFVSLVAHTNFKHSLYPKVYELPSCLTYGEVLELPLGHQQGTDGGLNKVLDFGQRLN